MISSSDRPAVRTANSSVQMTPIASTVVVMPKTPTNPHCAAKAPMMMGAVIDPTRPNDELMPTPVARSQVGKTSGV